MYSRLRQVAKEPLFHFMLIGAMIYGIYAFVGVADEEPEARRIEVTDGEIQWLMYSWTSRWNRPPTQEEFDGLLRGYVREQVLAAEAVAMGLDKDDTVIRRRMAQRLEMLTRDLLTPTDADPQVLQDWFEAHKDQYRQPVLYTMTQVYFDPDSRNAQALTDAENLRDRLNSLGSVPEDLRSFGDPFMLQNYYPEYTAAELSKAFGGDFVGTMEELEPGRWHGPVLSGYGVHVVLVNERRIPEDPVYAEVKDRVREDWLAQTGQELYQQFEASLIERYQVDIEQTDVVLLDPAGAGSAVTPVVSVTPTDLVRSD